MPATILGTRDAKENKQTVPFPCGAYILEGGATNNYK